MTAGPALERDPRAGRRATPERGPRAGRRATPERGPRAGRPATRRAIAWLVVAWAAVVAARAPAPREAPQARGVPALVFVSRMPLPPDSVDYDAGGAPPIAGPRVPGLGPRDRARAAGGRLMVRRANRVAPLVDPAAFFDVADPSVSWDGRRVVFAALGAPGGSWRLWTVNADGGALAPLTRDDRVLDLAPLGRAAARFARYDDLDPCWLPDGRVVFSSTRYPQAAQQGGDATNLFIVAPSAAPVRLTSERNGADEPSIEPRDGRIVYARWWFNHWLASEAEPLGVTMLRARAVEADPVDLWQAVAVTIDGDQIKLLGGNARSRPETMAYQPLVLEDGTLVGVRAEHTSLFPAGGVLAVDAYPGGFALPVRVAGGGPGSACAPAPLPDGRLVFSYDPTGGGDFGIWVAGRDGKGLARVLDLPGTLELDAAPLVARHAPPAVPAALPAPFATLPHARRDQLTENGATFRFDCMNVFANAPVDVPIPDAPHLEKGLRIRFYALLARPEDAGGDTVTLVREEQVDHDGGVHVEDIPADTPMFEQLVDAHGHVVRSASGPAHVPGANAGRFGTGTRCVGCHVGHSAIGVPSNYASARRFNVSPSARVEGSSVADGTAGLRAVVDRRAKGDAKEVAWVAAARDSQWVRLSWETPVEVDTVVIYALARNSREGTDVRIGSAEVVLLRDGRAVGRKAVGGLASRGTRVACGGMKVDAIEVRPMAVTGRVRRAPAVALGEIETIARIAVN